MQYAVETLEIELSRLKEVARKLELNQNDLNVDQNNSRMAEVIQAINILKGRRSRIQTISQIAQVVSEHLDVSVDDIISKNRRSDIVKARHFVMYLANKKYHQSLVSIARYLQVDHTTVIHGLKALENSLATDPATRQLNKFFDQQLDLLFEPVEISKQ